MVPYTRRRLLHVATATLAGLAGCQRLTGDATRPTTSPTEGDDWTANADGRETNPEMVLLRADAETPPVRLGTPDEEPTESRPMSISHQTSNLIIGSRKRRRRLRIDHPNGQRASAFLDATDFDSETVYLETNQVPECYRLRLCSVSWSPDKVRTDYARRLRPYDEACAADTRVFEARLIRLPAVLDEASVNSFASSVGGDDRCGDAEATRIEARRAGTPHETDAPAAVTGGESQ